MKDTLIKDILRYIAPTKKQDQKDIAKEQSELSFLESLVRKLDKEGKSELRQKKQVSKDVELEEILKIVEERETKKKHVKYGLKIERDSENESLRDYEIKIKYHDDDSEEKVEIQLKPTDKAKQDGKEEKSFSIVREKDPAEHKKGYSTEIEYTGNYSQEHVTINYNIPLLNYEEKKEINKQDFSNLAENKWLEIFPKSQMGGVLGFTYLGDGYQALRADMLYSPLGKMVDLHEAIHTPDEHETRVLTEWMMDIKRPAYKN